MFWILSDGQPVPAPVEEWARWWQADGAKGPDSERIVAQTTVAEQIVSTVFLGLDHQLGSGPPLLYETAVYSQADGHWTILERYPTREMAQRGHALHVKHSR